MSGENFRVIVVGAGVAGLAASLALQKAGIDHVVLERRDEVAPPEGASIAIYPHGARILHQLGCLEAAKAGCVPMERFKTRTPDAKVIADSGFFDYVKDNFAQDILLFERRAFLQLLYDALPDKSYIRTNCEVTDIKDDHTGVEVTLRDGTVERGDIVVGCDGAYSKVRSLMWNNAGASPYATISAKEKTSITTSWSCLIGMGPNIPSLGERDMTVVHNTKYSFLLLTQPDKTFWFVFTRLDEPFAWPQRKRYTDEDAEALANRLAGHPISDNIVFGEVWKQKYRSSLISLEEGILENWWHDRTVLVGDAAHKMTPNIALGGNTSLESVAVLTNKLHSLLEFQQGARPSRHQLGKAFAAYQQTRTDRVRDIMEYSRLITRLQAWDTPLIKFAATWMVPYLVPDRLVADDMSARIIATAPKFEFLPVGRDFARGKVEWADEKVERLRLEKERKAEAAVDVKGQLGSPSYETAVVSAAAIPRGNLLSDVKQQQVVVMANGGGSSPLLSSLVQLFGALSALIMTAYFMIVVT